jgi:hypothetical protein
MVTTCFGITPGHLAALRTAARRRHVSQGTLVREGLRLVLGAGPGDGPGSGHTPPRPPELKGLAGLRVDLDAARATIQGLAVRLDAIEADGPGAPPGDPGDEPPLPGPEAQDGT